MTLQQDIDYWRRWAQRSKTDAWLIAIGVAYGLTLARDEHAEEIAWLPAPSCCGVENGESE